MNLNWYSKRLRRMSAAEVAVRVGDEVRHGLWRRRQVRPGQWPTTDQIDPATVARFASPLPSGANGAVPTAARQGLLDAADELLKGSWEILGVNRHDLDSPDWFSDQAGRRAPDSRYCFSINHRSPDETGNIKQIWEVSRHQHLTVLAAAFYLSGDERYAFVVERQIQDWWKCNPFLSGVHWTSGIEVGLRLISWVWIRRLLDGWEGALPLFEDNAVARQQVRWHQEYLAAFRSTGSSANNHVIAEAAGQLVASCAFPWFPESQGWRVGAATLLQEELDRNTFPSGVNRELATAYHGFVAELGLLAAVEADVAGHPVDDATWSRLCQMLDVAAAVVDETLRPPRQGDDDEGRALLVDAPPASSWRSLLASGAAVFGALDWWPAANADVRSTVVAALLSRRPPTGIRPLHRPAHFPDAGLTILRTLRVRPEIWCRCDAGPHGFLQIAAHAHADALSIEVRCGGVDILADPGTFCYHGDPEWRAYFRSTAAHNTLELAARNQSESGGPFLWVRPAASRLTAVAVDEERQRWAATHDGYDALTPPATHRRLVELDPATGRLEIVDQVDGGRHVCRVMFHLGPSVDASLDGARAQLRWPAAGGMVGASMHLPEQLRWTAHRGQEQPILGWYSRRFGRKEPATTLVGTGPSPPDGGRLVTTVEFRL